MGMGMLGEVVIGNVKLVGGAVVVTSDGVLEGGAVEDAIIVQLEFGLSPASN